MRAAGYVRVSTGRQANEGWSLGEQEARVRSYVQARDWELVEVFVEAGVSGRRDDRPELARLLGIVGELDVLVVPKLDRLGRSTAHLWRLYGQLEAAGVALVSIGDGFDTSTPNGKLLRSVLSGLAELESDTISERVRVGKAARAREGRWNGGPPPYGYRGSAGELRIERREARVVRRIFERYIEGASQLSIARELNRQGVPTVRGSSWDQASVRRVLVKPVYAGLLPFDGGVVEGVHEPIVERTVWEAAQRLLGVSGAARGRGRGRPSSGLHLFRGGLLRCSCGAPMIVRTRRGRRGAATETYTCRSHVRDRALCSRGPVRRELIDDAVYRYFEHVALDVEATRAVIVERIQTDRDDAAAQLARAERDHADRSAALDRVEADYLAGVLGGDNYERLSAKLDEELRALDAEVELLGQRVGGLDARIRDAASAADAALEPIAELRQRIADELRTPDRVEGVRAAIARLFESFTLLTVMDVEPGRVYDDLELQSAPNGDTLMWLEPKPRPEAVVALAAVPWEAGHERSYTVVEPQLRRIPLPGEALATGSDNQIDATELR